MKQAQHSQHGNWRDGKFANARANARALTLTMSRDEIVNRLNALEDYWEHTPAQAKEYARLELALKELDYE